MRDRLSKAEKALAKMPKEPKPGTPAGHDDWTDHLPFEVKLLIVEAAERLPPDKMSGGRFDIADLDLPDDLKARIEETWRTGKWPGAEPVPVEERRALASWLESSWPEFKPVKVPSFVKDGEEETSRWHDLRYGQADADAWRAAAAVRKLMVT